MAVAKTRNLNLDFGGLSDTLLYVLYLSIYRLKNQPISRDKLYTKLIQLLCVPLGFAMQVPLGSEALQVYPSSH